MRTQTITFCVLLYILLSGCTPLKSQPSATLPPTRTSPSISTQSDTLTPSIILTATVVPGDVLTRSPVSSQPIKTADIDLFLPTGKAKAEWQGIPIMPNAFAGKALEDGSGYRFTVRGNYAGVEKFYTLQLPRIGWTLIGKGEGDGEIRIITFEQGNNQISIEILEIDEAERYMMVTIVLLK